MKRRSLTLMLLGLLCLPSGGTAKRFVRSGQAPARREAQVLQHRFGREGGDSVTLRLEPIRGRLRRGPRGRSRPVDLADYSRAGELVTNCELRLGPRADGPVRIPAGRHALSLTSNGPEGLPTLILRSEEGLRIRIVLPHGSRPGTRPSGLRGESLAIDGSPTWPVLLHMPTSTAMLVLLPAPKPERRPRRKTRVQSIHEALQERALRGGQIRGVQNAEDSRPE